MIGGVADLLELASCRDGLSARTCMVLAGVLNSAAAGMLSPDAKESAP